MSNKTEIANTYRQLLASNCLVLDTETTGLDDHDEIVEICVMDANGNVRLNTLVKPTRPIPAETSNIHGITNDMVANAPSWGSVNETLAALILNREVVIYNRSFDGRMIKQSCAIAGTDEPISDRVHCAMLDYAEFHGQWDERRDSYKWQRLTNACEQMGVPVQANAHRAHADVLMTLGLMRAMAAHEVQEGGAA